MLCDFGSQWFQIAAIPVCDWGIQRAENITPLLVCMIQDAMQPGIVLCDSVAMRIRIRIARCERPAQRQKPKPCETKAPFFPHFSSVGSQEWVLEVPKHMNRCDSCAQGAPGRRTVSLSTILETHLKRSTQNERKRSEQGFLNNFLPGFSDSCHREAGKVRANFSKKFAQKFFFQQCPN